MSDITHYEGCWQDPRHHACALTEIERLRGLLQEALESDDLPVEWYWRVRDALPECATEEK
jgi:hypothetical protein